MHDRLHGRGTAGGTAGSKAGGNGTGEHMLEGDRIVDVDLDGHKPCRMGGTCSRERGCRVCGNVCVIRIVLCDIVHSCDVCVLPTLISSHFFHFNILAIFTFLHSLHFTFLHFGSLKEPTETTSPLIGFLRGRRSISSFVSENMRVSVVLMCLCTRKKRE